MKRKSLVILSLLAAMTSVTLAGCSKDSEADQAYAFTLQLASGKKTVMVGSTDQIQVNDNGVVPSKTPEFEYAVSDSSVATVSNSGLVTGVKEGTVTFTVTEKNTKKSARLANIQVTPHYDAASGGYNYAAAAGEEAIETRTKILGSLEKYAMDSHLTGITLFENGGYVKYRDRLEIPASEYITGYGFGILSEGSINADLEKETRTEYKRFLHSASSSDPLTINALNASGSQVSDLSSYITSSYWATKMASNKRSYEWYPQLAKDTVNGKPFLRPQHVAAEENPLGLYNRWRIYVKTGEELKYRTASSTRSSFNNRNVSIDDYMFAYQLLLTGANKMSRGAEMAGDTSYGIKGAQQYYNATQNMTDQGQIDAVWNSMINSGDLGLAKGSDSNGDYIEIEIVNPVDEFTAMYTLSSSLVSPLPRAFFEAIGEGGSIINAITKVYGSFANGGDNAIIDNTLCLGAFYIKQWTKRQEIIFERNDDWFERSKYSRYNIPGVIIRTISNANENPDAIYNEFNSGTLDSCGIPTLHLSDEIGKPGVYQTKGDSTFKLNVNSCDEATWNKINEKVWHNPTGDTWDIKPWMSNEDFLRGLFHSINRKEFAEKRGVQPSINYFSDSYLSDPEKGISYNSTEEHKEAVKEYQVYTEGDDGELIDQFGYSYSSAVRYFQKAVNTLIKQGKIQKGTKSNPYEIGIHIMWMYESDKTEYGEDIIHYFESAFNDNQVSGGTVKLKVSQDAVTNWEDVYNLYLMKGKFDLGFGAISGNTYNPLNFLEVLKSDNSSGFTLNWGTDTSKIDDMHQLVYDGKQWSFDALWEVADHGGVVDNGSVVKTVKHAYMNTPKTHAGVDTDDFRNGAKVDVTLEFIDVQNVKLDLDKISLYISGLGSQVFPKKTSTSDPNGTWYDYDKANNVIHLSISAADGTSWNTKMREANKLRDEDPNPDEKPFILNKYGMYWNLDIYYSLSIKKGDAYGTPTQNYVSVARSADTEDRS